MQSWGQGYDNAALNDLFSRRRRKNQGAELAAAFLPRGAKATVSKINQPREMRQRSEEEEVQDGRLNPVGKVLGEEGWEHQRL